MTLGQHLSLDHRVYNFSNNPEGTKTVPEMGGTIKGINQALARFYESAKNGHHHYFFQTELVKLFMLTLSHSAIRMLDDKIRDRLRRQQNQESMGDTQELFKSSDYHFARLLAP